MFTYISTSSADHIIQNDVATKGTPSDPDKAFKRRIKQYKLIQYAHSHV